MWGQGKRSRRETYRRLIEELAVREHLPSCPAGVALDYGCGDGWLGEKLAQWGFRVLGVDVERGFLLRARKRSGHVLWALYQGRVLPIKVASLDLVVAVGVVRSLLDRGPLEMAIGEWKRCLKGGGRVIIIETDNSALRRHMEAQGIPTAMEREGFRTVVWHPIRSTSWWGLELVKLGLWPRRWLVPLAKWELKTRSSPGRKSGKKEAYLGEFFKP